MTDSTPIAGQFLLGYPMLYALFVVTMAGGIENRALEVSD